MITEVTEVAWNVCNTNACETSEQCLPCTGRFWGKVIPDILQYASKLPDHTTPVIVIVKRYLIAGHFSSQAFSSSLLLMS